MFVKRLLLFAVLIICIAADRYKVVETNSGQVRGLRKYTLLEHVPYYSFKGVPYAKPPLGELRFKAPQPVDSWAPKVLDAFEHGHMCMQPGDFMPAPLTHNEDCLTLNIYVPAKIKSNEKLAVLFFIHGGGFTEGSSNDNLYGPDFIIEKDTILVTINYRLGPFGFLSLDLPEYSGNMGLKDQQLALKWISENIGQFGGDNKRITIFGQSAGGTSSNHHILSSESRKYFSAAIPMSGSSLSFRAIAPVKNHLSDAHKMAEESGEPKKSIEELVAFLKTVPAETINKYAQISFDNPRFTIPYAPVVETKDAVQPFMVKSPKELYETSKIDVDAMFTVTNKECMSLHTKPSISKLKQLDADFNLPLPFREINLPMQSEEHRNLSNKIRQFYFGDGAIDEQALPQYYEYLSDSNYVYNLDKSVRTLAAKSKGKTYYTWFSVDSTLNIFKKLDIFKRNGIFVVPGAAHGDELCYLFRCYWAQPYYEEVINNKDDEQSKISLRTIDSFTKLFTNFAKYGEPSHQNDPVADFKPIQDGNIHYLDVNNDGLSTGLRPHRKAMEFWAKIEKKAIKYAAKLSKQKRDEL